MAVSEDSTSPGKKEIPCAMTLTALPDDLLSLIMQFVIRDDNESIRLACTSKCLGVPDSTRVFSLEEKRFVWPFSVLKWSRAMGCETTPLTAGYLARFGQLGSLKWLARQSPDIAFGWRTCYWAARAKRLPVLQWLEENHIPWRSLMTEGAAKDGHLSVLIWLRDHAYAFTTKTCTAAAEGGNLGILQWLRNIGCPWDGMVFRSAAREGHLHVLRWAARFGCPYYPAGIAFDATERGHLHVLQWIIGSNPRMPQCATSSIWRAAIKAGHLHILTWLKEAGIPWPDNAVSYAEQRGSPSVVEWIHLAIPREPDMPAITVHEAS